MSDDRSNSNKYVLSKHSKNQEDIISQNSHPYSQLSQYTTNSKNHIFKKEGNAYKKISAQDLTKYDLNNTDNNIIKLPKDGLIPVNEIHSFAPIGSQIIGNFHPNLQNSNHSSRYNIRLNNNVLYNNNNYDNDNRKRARKNWKILKSGFYMMQLFHSLRNYSFISKNMKKNRFITVQALKQNLIDIRNFLLPSMINIETFCLEHFTNYISLSTDDNEKYKISVYIIKSFIHQFFTDLTGSFAKKKDIPSKIKKIFRTFILDNSRLPYGFLTTFEFNRLEFDTEINLKNMNIQRQSLLVGFIILYRILLIDVLRNFEVYFPSFNYENNRLLKYSNSEKSISNNPMDTKMIEQVNFQTIILIGFVLMGLWGFYTKVMDMIKRITDRHDREKRWDNMDDKLSHEREEIIKRYDSRLLELENKIDENHIDTESKIQELKAEMYILTRSISAVLDGLKQQGCNGQVTLAKKELDDFLMERAYD